MDSSTTTEARVPYVFPPPGTNEIADTIRSRRKDGELLDLDGALLNAELVAKGWSSLVGTLRDQNSLSADIRELFILRVAVLNKAAYEWKQHEPVGRKSGLTTSQLLEIRLNPPMKILSIQETSLTPLQSAALVFTDYMTKEIKVPKEVYEQLKELISDSDDDEDRNRKMVEAVSTIGAYNMVSRFLVALDVGGMEDVEVPIPKDE
ncbi:4-carboxymuconolactone decarboxylase [Abortiporus biennis]|nr:4-carboxymuconolactone decarboxylase [Abortiporus biennis]